MSGALQGFLLSVHRALKAPLFHEPKRELPKIGPARNLISCPLLCLRFSNRLK